MRVIAGTAKGKTLASVPGDSTRAITDRTKSALFSILNSADLIEGKRYLDMFGGTGGVGIEALSRGAASAVFCERERQALRILRENLAATGLAERGVVIPGDAFAYLQRTEAGPFDVIYIAPPQFKGLWRRALELVDARPTLLAQQGVVIIQIFPKEWVDVRYENLVQTDDRKYGSTALYFFKPIP